MFSSSVAPKYPLSIDIKTPNASPDVGSNPAELADYGPIFEVF